MQTIRIASYNIRKAIGLDWKRTPDRILNVLGEIGADIVILQEADRRFGPRAGVLRVDHLSQRFDYRFVGFPNREESHGWHGNAILFRSPISPTSAQTVELPRFEPRGAVSATFAVGQHQVEVVGVHLSLLRSMRLRQVHALLSHADKSHTCCTVIGGDFNDRASDDALRQHVPREYEIVTPGASFHTSRPVWPLDRFLLRGASVAVTHSQVHHSENSRLASDHLPIYVDITLS